MDLKKFFKSTIKPPFSYNIVFNVDNDRELFDKIFNIYKFGLSIIKNIQSNNNSLNIKLQDINQNDIDLMKKYMLSIGIDVKYKSYDLKDKQYHIRELLYQIEKYDDIEIIATINWKTNNIKKVSFNIKDKKIIPTLEKTIKDNKEASIFLSINKYEKLSDYIIKYDVKNISYIIYFDFAKLSDYPNKFKTLETFYIK